MTSQRDPSTTDLLAKMSGSVRDFRAQATLEDTLLAIAHTVAEFLPTFEHVGVSLTRRGERIMSPAATTDVVLELDALQNSTGEGPCIDAIAGTPVVLAPHIRHEQRWQAYVPAAVRRGLQAQMAFHLYVDDEGAAGGLNLFSTASPEIDDTDVVLGNLFATNAAAALGKRRHVDSLTAAIEHRQVIGQAVGYLMADLGIAEDQARAYLWRRSSHENVKVRHLAAQIIDQANRDRRRT